MPDSTPPPVRRPRPPPRGLRLADVLTIGDETDETGRLLLEDSASKEARRKASRHGIESETSRCEYQDTPSRLGGLMNVSAYEALRRDFGEVLDGFGWLSRHYLRRHPGRRGTVQVLYDVSKLGTSLPLLLFHRARDPVPPHGHLPSFVANLFKAGRGLVSVSVDLLNVKGAAARTTAADVIRFADGHGNLVRPQTRRVCAAPTRLIERTIAVVLSSAGADPDASRLPELVEFEALWEFHRIDTSFSEACDRYRSVLERLEAATGGRATPARLRDVVIEVGGTPWRFQDFTQAFVEHANGLQAGLNRVLGRADNAPPLRPEDVSRIL